MTRQRQRQRRRKLPEVCFRDSVFLCFGAVQSTLYLTRQALPEEEDAADGALEVAAVVADEEEEGDSLTSYESNQFRIPKKLLTKDRFNPVSFLQRASVIHQTSFYHLKTSLPNPL